MNLHSTVQQNKIRILVGVNLIWSAAAWLYDWPYLRTIPVYAWIAVAICPLYPLLLAGVWHLKSRNRVAPPWLLSWASIGATTYGLGALVFYPTVMAYEGFSWLGVGAIAWVLAYGLQGFFLLKTSRLRWQWTLLFALLISGKTLLDGWFFTFGYLLGSTTQVPRGILYVLAGIIALLPLVLSFVFLRPQSNNAKAAFEPRP